MLLFWHGRLGVLSALTSICHRLIIQWHLGSTMPNQIPMVSFCGVFSMHIFYEVELLAPHATFLLFETGLGQSLAKLKKISKVAVNSFQISLTFIFLGVKNSPFFCILAFIPIAKRYLVITCSLKPCPGVLYNQVLLVHILVHK